MADQVENIWNVPPSSSPPASTPAPAPVSAGIMDQDSRERSIGDSITVASPTLATRMITNSPINPLLSNTTTSPELASPASSASSLSDPPSETNSPTLFVLDEPNIKSEPTEDNSGFVASNVLATNDNAPPRTKSAYYKPRVRGVDVCADPDTVEAYRVARAIADAEGELTIIGSRSLRSSNRLSSTKIITPLAESSTSNPPLNGVSGSSKKRGRNSINNKLRPTLPGSTLVAIKQEFADSQIEMKSFISATSPSEQRKIPKKRLKKRKTYSTSKITPGSGQEISSRLQTSNQDRSHIADRSVPSARANKGVRKKKPPQWSWVELKDDLGIEEDKAKNEQEQTKRHESLPPSLPSNKYLSPFDLDKRSLHQSRAWSEGPEEPRDHTPVVPQVYRKNGTLTDAVTITRSRLRPRKSSNNLTLESSMPRNSKQAKGLLKFEKGQRYNPTTPQKRALTEETEESSEDDLTQDGWSDENSNISEKVDDEGETDDSDDDDRELSRLEFKNKSPTVTTKIGNGRGTRSSKKRRLNSGESSYRKKASKPPPITDIKDLDPRVWPEAAIFVNGIYMIPNGCHNCLESHFFCNRKMPCHRCTAWGVECSRAEGLVPARPKQVREKDKGKGPGITEFMAPELLDLSLSPSRIKVRRGRPVKPLFPNIPLPDGISSPSVIVTPRAKKLWAKKGSTNKIKKEKDIQEVPMINLINPQEDKPPGIRRPEVWCESRQELCESLPYYRSYQSGCYGHDGLVHGYLLDGFPAPRDYIDGKVVISHSGGKSAADDDGQRRLLTNQTSEDKVIKYLLSNMKNQLPLVMIMGQHCCNSPSKLPHRYCVMDWFKVTAGWAERDPRSRFTRWKFRFEKLDTSTDGWWASSPSTESDTPEEMVKASCNTCRAESPHVYEEGWMCLKPECTKFWTLNNKDAPTDLKYTDNFLHCRTTWPSEFLTAPSNLGPSLSLSRDVFFDGGDVSRIFWKGMCCPKCGRLNCREFWAGWRCLSCDFKFDPPRTIFDAARLADPHRPIFTGPAIPTNACHEGIIYERFVKDGMTVVQYQLGDCGTVTHILANQNINARPKDADWLFREYQSTEMPFKRFPLGNHKSAGRLLTQQFTFNCGEPYKFIVDVESHPFDKSPPVVSRALEVIRDRVSLVHPATEFNEILNVGYFEKQKMDYHDDGEAGLGETVASISLGSPARMRFRVKARYTSERHCWTTRPPTPPSPLHLRNNGPNIKSEPKNDDLDLDEDEDEDPERNEDVIGGQQPPTSPVRGLKKGSKGRVKLDLCLNHGDVMVMKGRNIQKYWEHSVIPQGLFRIAATARFITESHPGVLKQIKSEAATELEKSPRKQDLIVPDFPTDASPGYGPAVRNNPVPPVNIGIDESPTCPPTYTTTPLIPDSWLSDAGSSVMPIGVSSGLGGSSINIAPNPNTFPALVSAPQKPPTEAESAQRLPNFPRADILHSVDQPIALNNSMSFASPNPQILSVGPQELPQTQTPESYDTLRLRPLQPLYPDRRSGSNIHRSGLDQGHNYFTTSTGTDPENESHPPRQDRLMDTSTSSLIDGNAGINLRNNLSDSYPAVPIQAVPMGIPPNHLTSIGDKMNPQDQYPGPFSLRKAVEVGDWTTEKEVQVPVPTGGIGPKPST